VRSDALRPAYLLAGEGSMTRATLTSNLLIADNLALDAVAAKSWSKHEFYLPSNYGKAELVWARRGGLRLSIATTYIGRRKDDYFEFLSDLYDGHQMLQSAWWMDGGIEWRSPHRRFEARLHVYNILGHAIDVYNFYPRFGRTAIATVSARF
jgi:outer membrane receptor protein involved in Fe transport